MVNTDNLILTKVDKKFPVVADARVILILVTLRAMKMRSARRATVTLEAIVTRGHYLAR